jgi:hypothetical protein
MPLQNGFWCNNQHGATSSPCPVCITNLLGGPVQLTLLLVSPLLPRAHEREMCSVQQEVGDADFSFLLQIQGRLRSAQFSSQLLQEKNVLLTRAIPHARNFKGRMGMNSCGIRECDNFPMV